MNILCFDTDLRKACRMRDTLRRAGFESVAATDARKASACLQKARNALVILSTLLPWKDTFPLLRLMRSNRCKVLFLAQSSDNAHHLRALYGGECEVAPLPWSRETLLEGIRNLKQSSDNLRVHGSLMLNLKEKRAWFHGKELTLTGQEYELLKALMANPNEPATREQLLRTAWGFQSMGETRTVDVHIQRLRRKLGASAIETVYKTGYRLAPV